MQRYFIETKYFNKNLIEITDKDFHHIKNVMRNKIGDELVVCNYQKQAYRTKIINLQKNAITVEIIENLKLESNTLNLTIAQSLIRKDNFELVLQKATELGVKEIIPLLTDRSIIKVNNQAKKLNRYKLIVKEASEQSERITVPTISDITKLEALQFKNYDLVLVAYAREDKDLRLSNVLKTVDESSNVLALIGPEGGFSSKELDFLQDKAKFISLGNTILRSETAGVYITSAIRYQWGN